MKSPTRVIHKPFNCEFRVIQKSLQQLPIVERLLNHPVLVIFTLELDLWEQSDMSVLAKIFRVFASFLSNKMC